MIEMWAAVPQDFQILKANIVEATGLGKDALHVYVGLAVFLTVRLLWRWRGGWLLAWLAAVTLAIFVEWLDMRALAGASPIKPDAAHWHDIWNTMFWPTVLLLIGRWLHPGVNFLPSAVSDDLADQPFKEPPAV